MVCLCIIKQQQQQKVRDNVKEKSLVLLGLSTGSVNVMMSQLL